VKEARNRGATTCISMGDFHHHRNQLNAHTLEYSIKFLSKLNSSFEHTYFILGNHDNFWRNSRTVTSTKFVSLFPNITLVDNPLVERRCFIDSVVS